MSKEMVISAGSHETRVAIMEDGLLCEIYVEREREFALVGSIYKGKVTRVLPGMQSAFVEIGLDSDAFLYVSDFLEDVEDLEPIVTTIEDKVQKMEEQGGELFSLEGQSQTLEPPDVDPQVMLPGESISPPPASAPQVNRGPAPSPSAPHREDSRRGGRRGRRGGRPGGRDLPSSKYAHNRGDSPRSAEMPRESGAHAPAASDFEPVILPGESLARFKEVFSGESSPTVPVPPPAAPDHDSQQGFVASRPEPQHKEPSRQPETSLEQQPKEFSQSRVREGESRGFDRGRDRDRNRDHRRGPERPRAFEPRAREWAIHLEPLPGETLSKARAADEDAGDAEITPKDAGVQVTSAEIAAQGEPGIPDRPDAHLNEVTGSMATTWASASEHSEERYSTEGMHTESHEQDLHESQEVPELTAEEATALAEHVAEAQLEEQQAEDAGSNGMHHDSGEEGGHGEHLADEHDGGHGPEGKSVFTGGELSTDFSEPASTPDQSGEMESAEASVESGFLDEAHGGELRAEGAPSTSVQQAVVRSDFRARLQQPQRRGRRDDRGRRGPQHGGGSRPQGSGSHQRQAPRRPQLISELLKAGQEIIVQIAKEPLGKKGARITSHIALPGRYLVYMPTLDHTGVSRKIASAEDRARLRTIVSEAKGTHGGGFIVRTAAASAPPEEVRADVEFLLRTWNEIKTRGESRRAPALLHRDLNLVERILRDHLNNEFGAIWVDSEEEFSKVLEFVSRFQPQLSNRVKLYGKDAPIFEEFGIQQEVDKALRPKVWLRSGGYIVINHTEALVAIDVNTGKFVGRGSTRLEDTIVKTNLEAVKEVVRQIRLRDLGGIIIIDFIDMEERRNRERVMAALEEALRADRAPSKVLRFNEFGLVAITRKRTKQALERTLCQPCPYCTGSGMVKSVPTLCYEIQAEARKMAAELDSGSITLRVHPEIAKALKTRESALIDELENLAKKSVIIQADPTLHWEQYDIY
jgi:Rne/Rng family ribonuclease